MPLYSEVCKASIRIVKIVDDEGVILVASTDLSEKEIMGVAEDEHYDRLYYDYEMRFKAFARELGKCFVVVGDNVAADDVVSL